MSNCNYALLPQQILIRHHVALQWPLLKVGQHLLVQMYQFHSVPWYADKCKWPQKVARYTKIVKGFVGPLVVHLVFNFADTCAGQSPLADQRRFWWVPQRKPGGRSAISASTFASLMTSSQPQFPCLPLPPLWLFAAILLHEIKPSMLIIISERHFVLLSMISC